MRRGGKKEVLDVRMYVVVGGYFFLGFLREMCRILVRREGVDRFSREKVIWWCVFFLE